MDISRRIMLAGGAALPLFPAVRPASPAAVVPPRFAVSSYSYWHFRGERYPIERVIESAARMGFQGVEVLHRQMSGESSEYLNKLKQLALRHGVALVMLSIHQDSVSPKPEERQKAIDHTVRCIDLAARLGIPAVRLNSGRWKTIQSFDDLMKVKGNEPPLAGYQLADAVGWCVDSIRECLPAAEKAGITLALENHWGLTTSIETLLAIWKKVNSPWLGINLDTGNFPGEPYAGIETLAPHATIVQAKTYYGGGEWYTLDLDYKRIAGILRKAGYGGWISLEMEGKEPPETAVPKSLAMLRAAFA
ncbi:MAG TPA: sugar phosphate isomerase/epimerase family protein [Bryobacteraceae bacterium]|nr:sugar phosphate isomerase/epimerase family protein [Bryobacteraceae bacterium]